MQKNVYTDIVNQAELSESKIVVKCKYDELIFNTIVLIKLTAKNMGFTENEIKINYKYKKLHICGTEIIVTHVNDRIKHPGITFYVEEL